jgi:antitoxin component YwqK of YwqJK toxin-antitoxin module
MRHYRKIFVIIILTISFEQSAKACTCMGNLTIDSLLQMKDYDFIAHVKIIDDQIFKTPSKTDYETIGQLTFEIIELFKGDKINKILEYSKNSSCDIGISKGEEWILFGKKINGRISIVACDRNERYKEVSELRDWKYEDGFYEIKQLKKIYQHSNVKYENESHLEFYKNGKKEIEEKYLNGKLNGERKIWYPNGNLYCKQTYINDTLDGKSVWFYESGQIYDEDYFLKGKPCNVSRLYFESSKDYSNKKLQTQYETVFDSFGEAILSREYTQQGKIYKEVTIDPIKKFKTVIYYHENGMISSIMYSLNGITFGHYQTYNENGFPLRGWDYDENGKAILNKE